MATLRQRKETKPEEESKGSESKQPKSDAKPKSSTPTTEDVDPRTEKQRRVFAWVVLFSSLWTIAVMLSLGYVIYHAQLAKKAGAGFGAGSSGQASDAAQQEEKPKVYHAPEGGILFTAEELAKYDGSGEKCYLSILGEVYDVSSGEYYREGGGYEFFAGKDASRGFHTGKAGEDLDSLEDLGLGALSGIVGWTIFYQQHENYSYVGKLVGTYYDEDGNPTQAKLDAVAAFAKIEEMNKEFDKEKLDEPDCNRWWNRESQKTEVYCTQDMIFHREPTSPVVPRKKQHPIDDRLRCACVELDKAKKDTETYILYTGCGQKADSCIVGEGE